ncbi:MAG: tRNA pseudouridine(38-40) synthase TruA [Deltaproteobacteria bacterium]|nr:tRNA pseudouridine(38-40) synthase TruA [Deltaproteobacteria bacterium]
MRTLRLVLEYDGTRHSGWHAQGRGELEDRPSVHLTLRRAIERLTGEVVFVRAASRTDAGVHAKGQVVAFETARDSIPIDGVLKGLNGFLPDSVAVKDCALADPGFEPRHMARGKHYRYRFLDATARSPLRRHFVWWQKRRLDDEAMDAAAKQLVGSHDFEAFRAADCSAAHAIRTMYRVDVSRVEDEVWLDVVGNAFCRHMVRVFAGTLKDVGVARKAASNVAEILASKNRALAGMTAPPEGLSLLEVIYDDRLPPRPNRGSVELVEAE